MLVLIRWMIGIAVGAGLCQAYFRSTYPKDFETAFKHLKGLVHNFHYSNDVIFDSYPNMIIPRNRKKGLTVMVPPTNRDCPAYLTEPRPAPLSSVYPIGEMSFSVPTPTASGVRKRRVHAKCGLLRGLDDFQQLPPSLIRGRSDPNELWLSWSRLRATCAVSTELDGLPDNLGETEVRINSMYMVVRQEESGVQVEVAPSRDARIDQGFKSLSKDEQDAIKVELRTNILCIVNTQVMNSLKDFVKEGLTRKDASIMSKLTYLQ